MLVSVDLAEIGCTAFIRAEKEDGILHLCCYDLLVVLGGYSGKIRRIWDLCSSKKVDGLFKSRCGRLGKLRPGYLWFASGEALLFLLDQLGNENFDLPHLARAVVREVMLFPEELTTYSEEPLAEVETYFCILESLRSSKDALKLQAILRLKTEFTRLHLREEDFDIIGRMFSTHTSRNLYPEEEVYLYLLVALRLSKETKADKAKLLVILTECFSAIDVTTKSFGG